MTCIMQIRIPLKHALTTMWVDLVQKKSKKSYENTVGEPKVCKLGLLSLQFDSISMRIGPPLKFEVETPIYREMYKNTRDHPSRGTCVHATRTSRVNFMLFWGLFLGFLSLLDAFSMIILSKSTSIFVK